MPFSCCSCGSDACEPFLTDIPDRLHVVPWKATYVRCRSCGLIALFPRPTFEETASFYPKSFWRTDAKPEAPSPAARFETWFRNRLVEADFAIIAPYVRAGMSHLDVGCATGDFMMLCQAHGTRSTGIELGAAAAAVCRERGLDAIAGDLVRYDFGGRKFDVITYNGVLEHVTDPRAHLEKCASLLAPGGRLLLLGLPNIRSAGFRLNGRRWIGLDAPRHIHQFSAESLGALLERSGYRLIHLEFRSPRFNPPSLVASVFPALHRHEFDAYQAKTGRNPVERKAALLALLQLVRPLDAVLCRASLGEHMTAVAELSNA